MGTENEDVIDIVDVPDPPGPVIEVDLETGAEVNKDAPVEAKTDPGPAEPDPGLKALQDQLARSRAAERDAEQRRIAAENRAIASEAKAGDAHKASLQSLFSSTESEIARLDELAASAENAIAAASAAGNHLDVAKATRALARIEADKRDQEILKAQIVEAQARPVVKEGPVEDEQPRKAEQPRKPLTEAEAVENLALTMKSQASADWIRAHPEVVKPAMYHRMVGGHFEAMENGLAVDSPEYFSFIEERLQGPKREPAPAPAQARQEAPTAPEIKRVAAVTAPPSRGDSTPLTYRLTAEEQEIAALSGMTNKEYALEQLKIKAERAAGKLN